MRRRYRGRERRLLRAGRALAASLLAVTASTAAFAQSAPEEPQGPALLLEWSGPGPELDCLGEEHLKRAVNDYLGRDAFGTPVELVLHVTVERLPDRHFHATLEVGDATGRKLGAREIISSTELCSSLDERLILAVALLADAGPEAPEPPPAPPERPPVPPEPEDDGEEQPPAPVVAPAHRQPWGLAADASLVVEGGLLPAVRPGLSLGASLQPAPWVVARAGALAFLPASKEVPGASARFSFFAGTAELCAGELRPGRFQTAICGGALYAGLRTETHGLTGGHHGTRAQLAGLLGFELGEPVGSRVTVLAGANAVFPYRPERFSVHVNSEARELFQLSKPAVLARLGAAVTF